MVDIEFNVRRIATILRRFRYLFGTEVQLHESIARVLTEAGETVKREVILDRQNRADVMLENGILIEVKIHESLSAALRQCTRYSELEVVKGIVLASTVSWARRSLVSRPLMNGKPFALAFLQRQSL